MHRTQTFGKSLSVLEEAGLFASAPPAGPRLLPLLAQNNPSIARMIEARKVAGSSESVRIATEAVSQLWRRSSAVINMAVAGKSLEEIKEALCRGYPSFGTLPTGEATVCKGDAHGAGVVLYPKQQTAVGVVASCVSQRNERGLQVVLIIGTAGSGKSAVAHALVDRAARSGWKLRACGSTNTAAAELRGETFHKLCRMPASIAKKKKKRETSLVLNAKARASLSKMLAETDVILVDEVGQLGMNTFGEGFMRFACALGCSADELPQRLYLVLVLLGDFWPLLAVEGVHPWTKIRDDNTPRCRFALLAQQLLTKPDKVVVLDIVKQASDPAWGELTKAALRCQLCAEQVATIKSRTVSGADLLAPEWVLARVVTQNNAVRRVLAISQTVRSASMLGLAVDAVVACPLSSSLSSSRWLEVLRLAKDSAGETNTFFVAHIGTPLRLIQSCVQPWWDQVDKRHRAAVCCHDY